VTSVDELVGLLRQGSKKQTHRSTRQISKESGLTQCSIVQIIHLDLGPKCHFRVPTRLLPIIVSFSYIYISQGSVATHVRCGEIYNNQLIASKIIVKIG